MVFEIVADMLGNPFLKRNDRRRRLDEPRGQWMEIGRVTDPGISYIVETNQRMGLIVLQDEEGYVRVLVLTD